MGRIDLIKETKAAMGYTKDPAPACSRCRHRKEEAHEHLDRSWYHLCTYSDLALFEVDLTDRCKKFSDEEGNS